MLRKSKYPMTSVEEARGIVLRESQQFAPIILPVQEALNCVVSEDIKSNDPVPRFPTSIMDGYAVVSSDGPGEYEVIGNSFAGVDPTKATVTSGKVMYVTTGGPVPNGADAVVQVEKTEAVKKEGTESEFVRILVQAVSRQQIREVGSDCQKGEIVVGSGECLGSTEVGLCAMVGVTHVSVYPKPIIGVMSTGDEIVPFTETPAIGQIRDSNRPMLLAAIKTLGYNPLDLGIAPDSEEKLHEKLNEAISKVDILITSGGVSMGKLDLWKPLLEKMGNVHFGRLNMKPGMPTTFATIKRPDSPNSIKRSENVLIFGLPGNPVSSLVTMTLLVIPAARRISGHKQTELPVVMSKTASDVKMDPERPEYHRVQLAWNFEENCYIATSTGGQRSSRLLSLRGANGLLCLPAGDGVVPKGSIVKTILLPFSEM